MPPKITKITVNGLDYKIYEYGSGGLYIFNVYRCGHPDVYLDYGDTYDDAEVIAIGDTQKRMKCDIVEIIGDSL